MVQGEKSRLLTELPGEVLRQFGPKLAELYSQVPEALSTRISLLGDKRYLNASIHSAF